MWGARVSVLRTQRELSSPEPAALWFGVGGTGDAAGMVPGSGMRGAGGRGPGGGGGGGRVSACLPEHPPIVRRSRKPTHDLSPSNLLTKTNIMADLDGQKKNKEFFAEVPQAAPGFFLKGSHQYDWGLKNRLSRVFNPKDGRTLMLAFDHGYFQGPTTGLERIDQTILPLEPYVDCLMLTRGIQRSIVPATTQKAIALRASMRSASA